MSSKWERRFELALWGSCVTVTTWGLVDHAGLLGFLFGLGMTLTTVGLYLVTFRPISKTQMLEIIDKVWTTAQEQERDDIAEWLLYGADEVQEAHSAAATLMRNLGGGVADGSYANTAADNHYVLIDLYEGEDTNGQ